MATQHIGIRNSSHRFIKTKDLQIMSQKGKMLSPAATVPLLQEDRHFMSSESSVHAISDAVVLGQNAI
jgi:hypothetical protein